jgi:cation transport protein ChaC
MKDATYAPFRPYDEAGDSPDFWVFAYGSLIWNPGFPYKSREPVKLIGYHRRYCICSMVYRGTPEKPGLVLGLEAGGVCEGVGYRVAGELKQPTLQYLRERELITSVYHEKILRIETREGVGHDALTYVADPDHEQYVDSADFDAMIDTIASASGDSGPNAEYALNTWANLSALGVSDPLIEKVAEALRRRLA